MLDVKDFKNNAILIIIFQKLKKILKNFKKTLKNLKKPHFYEI